MGIKKRGAMFCFNSGLEDSALPNVPNIYEQSPRGKRESFWLVLGTLKVLKVCSFQDPSWLKRYILYVMHRLYDAGQS